jgi:hypothetical protein
MARACADVFALGYQYVMVIGTDLPTLPGSAFGEAVKLLAAHDLVLGPSRDGGYYLIGLRKPAPELFAGIPWSTDRVLALTQQKAAALGLRTALLPVRRDIDTVDDLRAVIDETGLRSRAPQPVTALSPRTAGVLRLLVDRLCTPNAPRRAGARP